MSTRETPSSTKWEMSSEGRSRGAVAQSKKDARLLEYQSARADYDAAQRAQALNMARLRELRLARDAANVLRPPADVPAVKKRKPRKKPAAAPA